MVTNRSLGIKTEKSTSDRETVDDITTVVVDLNVKRARKRGNEGK